MCARTSEVPTPPESTEIPRLDPGKEELGKEELDEADLELLRWMRSLTSEQRLQVLQDFVDGVTRLRNGRVE